MPEIKIQGLRGLRGLSDLTPEEQNKFMSAYSDELEPYRNPRQRKQAANILYMNQKFINQFGIDTFNKMDDGTEEAYNMRNQKLHDTIINKEFDKLYKPTRVHKGLGDNYTKYNQLSADSKLKLLESDYLTPEEFESNWKRHQKKEEKPDINIFGIPIHLPKLNAGILPISQESLTGNGTADVLNDIVGNEAKKKYLYEKNQKILDRIYNDDADKAASRLESAVAKAYWSYADMSDDGIKKAFVKAITKGSYVDKNGVPNMGIAEYESHYGKGTDNDISSEMHDFSIDDMRQVLAQKQVYDTYLSPEMANTALNNAAKRYIKAHQGSIKKLGLFSKDLAISTLSYTADKMNGIAELGRKAQDALMEKPVVLVDDRANVLDPNKVNIVRDKRGNLMYKGEDGRMHPVHQEQIAYSTLHQMGKNPDGSDIKGAFGIDFLTLNPQYWTRAEQFGTLDENLQKQYERIGSSPYKVAYDPNEDSDLMYEVGKMASFGIADAGAQLIPFGIGAFGNFLSTASKAGKIARGFGKVLDTTGKLLTAETKTGQVLQGASGALGISYAYGRGVFQETLQQNLANAEEAVQKASKKDIYDQYHKDKTYRTQVDRLINAKAAGLKASYMTQLRKDGGMQVADEAAIDKMLHAKAQEEVLGELVQSRIKERMSSKEYAALQQKAIEGAGDAAFNTFWPEAIKYGFVNTMGYRRYLYTNPAGLSKKMSKAFKGLEETTTKEGKKRMSAGASKFLTRKDKFKELGKTTASQLWGGAWTNGTDDMQVDAAERMNEDSFNRYLRAYQTGEAMADVYGFADGLYSYINGFRSSLGESSTWRSALVGGLGGVMNITPNFVNIARLATKEGREAYKNNFWRTVERDEKGIAKKNEDGSIKYQDLGRSHDLRGQLNYFIQNGVLNTYYGKKQSERDLQSHADYVNNLLDQYDDFTDIERLVASNIASENLSSRGDKKTMDFIRALNAMNVLNRLGNDSNDPTTMSSVVQKARELIDKASQLEGVDLDKGENPLSEEDTKSLLTQYYAANPGVPQNEYNNRKALKTIAHNAQKLKEASEAFDKAEEEIQKIEENQKLTIAPAVRTELKIQQALNKHWTERKEQMQAEIEDASTNDRPQEASIVIATVGGMKNAQSLVKVYDRQWMETQKQLAEQNEKTEALQKELEEAEKALDEANSNSDSETILKAEKEQKQAKARLQSSKEAERYLEGIIARTNEKTESIEGSIKALQAEAKEGAESKDRVLTADEIFALDPVTRARMMQKENRDLYSKEQQREIEKLEQTLIMKDADALQKVQDIALLTQRIAANEDAYSRIAKNPEAAAVAVGEQRMQAAEAAYRLINQRNAEIFADYVNQYDEEHKEDEGLTEKVRKNSVYRLLRRLNSDVLDVIEKDVLLPQYTLEVASAHDWKKTVEDIDAIVSNADKDEAWKKNLGNNIDTIVESANNKEEIMASLEKVIDDVKDPKVISDFEYVLNGMEKIGYQRDATTIENRKEKKERIEKEKEKVEEEKKKVEGEAKAAAEKKAKEEEEKKTAEGAVESTGDLEDVGLLSEEEGEGEKTVKEEEKKEEEGAEGGDTGKEEPAKGSTIEKVEKAFAIAPEEYENTEKTTKHEEKAAFEVHSIEEKGGELYFNGNFAGTNEETQVKAKKGFGRKQIAERQQEERLAAEEAAALEGMKDEVKGETPSIEKQYAESGTTKGKEMHLSDNTEDSTAINATGEQFINTDVTTLSGNGMSEYELEPMRREGILTRKKGKKADDTRSTYYPWMDAAGIKLQNIIDQELARIIKDNPHAKVKFMAVKPADNATKDIVMQNHLMLVLDYDDNINKGITLIHEGSNGGVIESNGKKYLVIGVVGFGKNNLDKRALYDILWNSNLPGGLNLKRQGKQYFDAHPTDRFYVNEKLSTEIVPQSLIPGYIVRQMKEDGAPKYRSVRELLATESRNPLGYDLQSVAWGIQENSKFLIVGATPENVMIPRNKARNLGSAFVLMPAGNGKLVPSYLKVLKYNEMKDGALKAKVNTLLQEVVSPNYDASIRAMMQLQNIFYMHRDGDYILRRKNRNEVSLTHNGEVFKTFVLDSNFDRAEFIKAIEEMNPRVNITARVLRSEELLKEYDEAGALMTDAALFGTAGSSYSIYALDGEGKMIVPQAPENEAARRASSSDFKKERSQVVYKHQYYIEDNGEFSLNGKVITDEKLIEQLQYIKKILDNKLLPATSKQVYDYYILSTGEHPEVIRVNRNTKEVTEATREQAKKVIEETTKKEEEKRREEAAAQALEEEKKGRQELDAEDVDLGEEEYDIDPETGDIIQISSQPVTLGETKTSEESRTPKEEKVPVTPVLHTKESVETLGSTEKKAQTQKFGDLLKNKKYMLRLRDIIKSKWGEMPMKTKELTEFLRSKDIEVDAIGTSEKDVEAWIKTLEECR